MRGYRRDGPAQGLASDGEVSRRGFQLRVKGAALLVGRSKLSDEVDVVMLKGPELVERSTADDLLGVAKFATTVGSETVAAISCRSCVTAATLTATTTTAVAAPSRSRHRHTARRRT